MNPAILKITSIQKDTRVWQFITLTQTLLFSSVIALLKIYPEPQPDILFYDKTGYYIGKLEDFEESTELHENQTEIAALCLFQRSPHGLDYKDRLQRLFSTDAYNNAMEMVNDDMNEFLEKSLHQKLEISKITHLQVRGNVVLTSLQGQLIRTGSFQGKTFTEKLDLNLEMQFVRNPNMARDESYPSIVTSFNFIANPISR